MEQSAPIRVKLKHHMAGPAGSHRAGSVVDLPAAQAEHLLRTGQADEVADQALATTSDDWETGEVADHRSRKARPRAAAKVVLSNRRARAFLENRRESGEPEWQQVEAFTQSARIWLGLNAFAPEPSFRAGKESRWHGVGRALARPLEENEVSACERVIAAGISALDSRNGATPQSIARSLSVFWSAWAALERLIEDRKAGPLLEDAMKHRASRSYLQPGARRGKGLKDGSLLELMAETLSKNPHLRGQWQTLAATIAPRLKLAPSYVERRLRAAAKTKPA